MPSIGSFGAAVREIDPEAEPVTFEFFGQTFTIHDIIPPMLMIQLGAVMAGKVALHDANAAVYEAFRSSLIKPAKGDEPADVAQFEKFRRLAINKRCADDELISLVFALVGAQSDLPTERQPTSPDGPLPTSENLNSSSPDTPDSPTLMSVEDRIAGLE